ncbi:MAG: hypothetical protein ACOC80_11240 [Petrotogales bacterium]
MKKIFLRTFVIVMIINILSMGLSLTVDVPGFDLGGCYPLTILQNSIIKHFGLTSSKKPPNKYYY